MDNCNSSNAPFNVRLVIPEGTSTEQVEYEVRGVSPIKVKKQLEGSKVVFIISYSPSIAPTCSISVSPAIAELGVTAIHTFTYVDNVGSSPILTRVKSPNDSPLKVRFNQAGSQGLHSYSVTDTEGLSATSSVAILVKYRFFKGTIVRNNDALDVTTIQALVSNLGSTIGEAFPKQAYIMDKPQGHFLWVYPADFASIPTPTGDANLPFDLVPIAGTWVINGITYKAAKTATYFTNGGTANLGF